MNPALVAQLTADQPWFTPHPLADINPTFPMKNISFLTIAAVGALSLATVPQSSAATIFADTVLAYFDSGAGSMPGPYGGIFPGGYPVPVPLTYATDGNPSTFLSLPTGSYITLGFSTGFVFDGLGLDIFVSEVGGANETADIYVSSDYGTSFTFLGTATTSTVSGFDLASIGYTSNVNAVKIIGLDSFGGSPGFDLAYVEGLEGSVVSTVPDSMTTVGALASMLILFATSRRIRRQRIS